MPGRDKMVKPFHSFFQHKSFHCLSVVRNVLFMSNFIFVEKHVLSDSLKIDISIVSKFRPKNENKFSKKYNLNF